MMERRAYFFQNTYVSGIHAGIQSQHCTTEMFIKYTHSIMHRAELQEHNQGCEQMLYDWAYNHKTTIVLNGGFAKALYELSVFLDDDENKYPWAYFKESEDALDGCITNVGIILPEKIFNCPKEFYGEEVISQGLAETHRLWDYTKFHLELAKRVAECRLMN